MAINRYVLLFYTVLLKLKLVSHLLSNRNKIFTKTSLIILLKTVVSIFGYQLQMLSCVEVKLCMFIAARNLRVYLHIAQHLKVLSKNGNRSFLVKLSNSNSISYDSNISFKLLVWSNFLRIQCTQSPFSAPMLLYYIARFRLFPEFLSIESDVIKLDTA